MASTMDTVAATRANLLARRSQIRLAQDGVRLLKGKREALLRELLIRARRLMSLRKELHRRGRSSAAAMAMARAVRGTPEVTSVATAGRRELDVRIHYTKVWGLELCDVEEAGVVRVANDRGVGLLDFSSHILDAAVASELMVEQLVACAPVEANLRLLGSEVQKVTRRINALEEGLLPRLRRQVRRIAAVLDEREREDMFRLKRIKRKKAAERMAAGS